MIRATVALLLSVLVLAGCGRPAQVQTLSGLAQGTTWHVTVWRQGGVDIASLRRRINTEFERLDGLLSNYRDDSVIEQFNAAAVTAPIAVGEEIVRLIEAARAVSEASAGCYDLTVKPLFDLWGFTGESLTVPDPAVLARTRERVGFRHLMVMPPDKLRKVLPGLRVDLSSIAQGYSVGRIAMLLEAAGIVDYIVEIGGELQTRGHKPEGGHWRIGVERPLPGERSVEKALTIKREAQLAIMTSGTYRHYYDAQGRRYSHVLDARAGRPITHDTVSVTVLDDDPVRADAWSTALLCLGHAAGLRAADQAGIAALFIADENGRLREQVSTAWSALQDVEVQ